MVQTEFRQKGRPSKSVKRSVQNSFENRLELGFSASETPVNPMPIEIRPKFRRNSVEIRVAFCPKSSRIHVNCISGLPISPVSDRSLDFTLASIVFGKSLDAEIGFSQTRKAPKGAQLLRGVPYFCADLVGFVE